MKFVNLAVIAVATTQAIKLADDETDFYSDSQSAVQTEAAKPTISFTTKGSGDLCKSGQTASVQYTGSLASNGNVFDSSKNRNEAFNFNIGEGRVIKCWEQAIVQLHQGDKATVACPASIAYGERAMGDVIPANSDLNFAIEVEGCQ